MSLKTLWEKTQEEIKGVVGKTSYDTWFSAIEVTEKNPETLVVESPDDFFKNWIVEHYQDLIKETICRVSGSPIAVEFSVNPNMLKKDAPSVPAFAKEEAEGGALPNLGLNSRFTFDSFVVGPSNRFACAASLAVAESPAKAYNPLFIYGSVGLGKTHLIQAITHKLPATSKIKILLHVFRALYQRADRRYSLSFNRTIPCKI